MKKIPLWPALLAAAELSAAGGVKPAAFLWCEAPPELARLFGSAGLKPEKAGPGNTDAPVQFLSGRFDHAANAKRYVDAVRAGKTVFVGFRDLAPVHRDMAEFLPVTPWSVKSHTLRRGGKKLVGFPGSGYEKLPPLAISNIADLHVPGAPIENSLMRYLTPGYLKPLNITDFRVLLTTDAGVPALISARVGAARVYVCGGDLFDPVLAKSPGYPALMRRLLKEAAAPLAQPKARGNAAALQLEVPEFQPEGPAVTVKNPGTETVDAVLSFQLYNWEYGILNAASGAIALKPGESRVIRLAERGAFKGDSRVTESGSAPPWRRLRVGILTPDRSEVVRETERKILTASPLALQVIERDSGSRHEVVSDGDYDGNTAGRYVWPAGSSPKITVRVGNGYENLAPLAEVSDLQWPENPTAPGLNDRSLSRGNVRRNGEMQGAWAGKPAATQKLKLTWPFAVTVAGAGIEGYGPYRFEERLNPKHFTLGSGGRTFVTASPAEYVANGSDIYRHWRSAFAPETVRELTMSIDRLDPKLRQNVQINPTNSSMKELEVFGWPAGAPIEEFSGTLTVTASDLVSGKVTEVASQPVKLAPYSEQAFDFELPGRSAFGPVRYDIVLSAGGKTAARGQYDALFRPEGGAEIIDKSTFADYQPGLLCTPGWYNYNSFGLGMFDYTRGWGGPHDKIWALVHGLMETGPNNIDAPERMLTTDTRNSHYTNPWRSLPDGSYGWDLTLDCMFREMTEGRRKGQKSIHVGTSDRWNGIPVNNSFGWDTFDRFDRHLKKTGGEGLKGKTRRAISEEICTRYFRDWQEFLMREYAEKTLATKKKFEDAGISFSMETHGSFPLAGGELGDLLGETHLGVGTDLFWELRNQDLYWSLGTRFAIVAANPNLRSGLYKQWGWVNSESNATWFSNNSSVEPARRQWYNTYFTGRVDSEGRFLPYHVYGYSLQGGISTRFYAHEIKEYTRVFNFTRLIRPEKAAGYGFAVSWGATEKRIGRSGRRMGFGIYTSGNNEDQLEYRMGKLYEPLVKNGLPIGFVTSGHALAKWEGKNPLVLLDAADWPEAELANVRRLADGGAPVIGFGGDDASAAARKFWTEGAARTNVDGIELYVRRAASGAPVIWCPLNGTQLPGEKVGKLVDRIMELAGGRIQTASRLAVTPFLNNGALFFGLGSQADAASVETVQVVPESFDPALQGRKLAVIDLDRNVRLDAKPDRNGVYAFELPVSGSDGRMIMMIPEE